MTSEPQYGGGYNFDFAEDIPEDLMCSALCTKVLRDPQLTACCGQHFCKSCLQHWFTKHNRVSCPYCREENVNYIADKSLKRKIDELKIRCSKSEAGCNWVGELSTLGSHLKSEQDCGYIEVDCTSSCGKKLNRKDLADHITQHCPLRKYECQYCETVGTYQSITEEHYDACKNYPLKCPNDCGATEILRAEVDRHRTRCPLEPALCPFSEAGCDVSLVQKELEGHTSASVPQHLQLVMDAFQLSKTQSEQQIQTMKTQSEQKIQLIQEQTKQEVQKSREEIQALRRQCENLNRELRGTGKNISTIVDCLLETCAPSQVASLQSIHAEMASHRTSHRLNKFGDSVEFTIAKLLHYVQNNEDWYSPLFYYKDCEMQLVVSISNRHASFSICMYEEPLVWVHEPINDSDTLNVCFEDDDGEGVYDAVIRVPIRRALPESKDGQTKEWHSVYLRRDSMKLTIAF